MKLKLLFSTYLFTLSLSTAALPPQSQSKVSMPSICTNDNCEEIGDWNPQTEYRYSYFDFTPMYMNFTTVTKALSIEIENEFDGFIFINSRANFKHKSKVSAPILSCPNRPLDIPPQFGKIIWKKNYGAPVFKRDPINGSISGILNRNTQQLHELDGQIHHNLEKEVYEYLDHNKNKSLFPISTGNKPGNYRKAGTPSGIFNVDYEYTLRHLNRTNKVNKFEAMPFTLLANYTYGKKYGYSKFAIGVHGTPENYLYCKKWHNGAQRYLSPACPPCVDVKNGLVDIEKINSGCLVKDNLKSLGRWQDSAGCMRTVSRRAEIIRNWAMSLKKPTLTLNPKFALPQNNFGFYTSRINFNVLFIVFEGFSPQQSCFN